VKLSAIFVVIDDDAGSAALYPGKYVRMSVGADAGVAEDVAKTAVAPTSSTAANTATRKIPLLRKAFIVVLPPCTRYFTTIVFKVQEGFRRK
jgi:hypothetical protein